MIIECCNCDLNDGDPIEMYDCKWVKARKEHKCYECGEMIKKDERYFLETYLSLYDHKWKHIKTCNVCISIGCDFLDSCHYIGDIREAFKECYGFDYMEVPEHD